MTAKELSDWLRNDFLMGNLSHHEVEGAPDDPEMSFEDITGLEIGRLEAIAALLDSLADEPVKVEERLDVLDHDWMCQCGHTMLRHSMMRRHDCLTIGCRCSGFAAVPPPPA